MSDSDKNLDTNLEEVVDNPESEDVQEAAENSVASLSDEAILEKKRKRASITRNIIMGVAIVVFVVCAAIIVNKIIQYKKAQNIYNDAEENYVSEIETPTKAPDNTSGQDIYPSKVIDFAGLKEMGKNVIAWIDIPSLGISYPVVQGEDNSFYLQHTYNDEFSWSGAIYIDYTNAADFTDAHTFIYGHNMKDGSMFSALLDYDSEAFYLKHKPDYIYIYLEDCIKVYEPFSVCDVYYSEHPNTFLPFASSSYLMDYVDYVRALELYSTDITITEDDKVLTLYTCQGLAEDKLRHMMHTKLVATLEY